MIEAQKGELEIANKLTKVAQEEVSRLKIEMGEIEKQLTGSKAQSSLGF